MLSGVWRTCRCPPKSLSRKDLLQLLGVVSTEIFQLPAPSSGIASAAEPHCTQERAYLGPLHPITEERRCQRPIIWVFVSSLFFFFLTFPGWSWKNFDVVHFHMHSLLNKFTWKHFVLEHNPQSVVTGLVVLLSHGNL